MLYFSKWRRTIFLDEEVVAVVHARVDGHCGTARVVELLVGRYASSIAAHLDEVGVGEAGELRRELEAHLSHSAAAVLGQNNVGHARRRTFIVGINAVVFWAIDEHDDVGILLDSARLTQVAEHRLFGTAAGFHRKARRQQRVGNRRFFPMARIIADEQAVSMIPPVFSTTIVLAKVSLTLRSMLRSAICPPRL